MLKLNLKSHLEKKLSNQPKCLLIGNTNLRYSKKKLRYR